ncbi:MAG: beta-ketoacyl-ACP reductase [Acidobacteria bacterium]|nr:beta-ketoacyl-ACP reductase [Acidobacteriota bacterium]
MDRAFSGTTALITGGSRGIGLAVALRLARDGCAVDLLGRTPAALEAAAGRIRAEAGAAPRVFVADLGAEEGIETAVRAFDRRDPPYDFLVNNAGIARDGLLLRMRPEQWEEVLRVNLTATFRVTRAVLPGMVRARRGKIVNLASVVALTGNPGQANYVAAKAGIIGFTKSLAREVGARGITVNAVAPGLIDTDMTRALPEPARQAMLERVPLGRAGTPEDVAGAVAFLLSPAADYITGIVLNVSGGLHM